MREFPQSDRPFAENQRCRGLRDLNWGGTMTVYDKTGKVKEVVKNTPAYEAIIKNKLFPAKRDRKGR